MRLLFYFGKLIYIFHYLETVLNLSRADLG